MAKDEVISAFRNIAEEFIEWKRQWDLFERQETTKKPPHLDELIKNLEQKYVVEIKNYKDGNTENFCDCGNPSHCREGNTENCWDCGNPTHPT